MELTVIITMLCISLSVLLTPCASLHTHVQSSHELAHEHHHALPALPRKLKFNEKVEGYAEKDLVSYNKRKEVLSGKSNQKGEEMGKAATKGTRQEWIEGTDPSQFFTMDYSHVRRRRPIHNKSLPIAP